MEATTTLADALLDDLDDLMDSDEGDEQDDGGQPNAEAGTTDPLSLSGNTSVGFYDDEVEKDRKLAAKTTTTSSLSVLASPPSSRFLDSTSLQHHLTAIRKHAAEANSINNSAPVTSQREMEDENHRLVVQSNRYLASLSDEMAKAHGALAKLYKPKFPELEELLPNYLQYKNAVRIIWNETDLTRVNDELNEILSSNQIITISVAGSTTSGRPLTEAELNQVDAAAAYMEELLVVQKELMAFVESSMESLCPSICALIGPSTAARLLGLAGGLHELTKIPSCNLQVMGQVKHNSESRAGLSGASLKQHVGLLAESDIVQSVPRQYQKKATKVVAAKLSLAARFDFVNVDTGRTRSASTGLMLKAELLEKFEKWQEPDKAPVLKALPKPDLEVKKRRGGRRMRRWKERFEETAMMKQVNTRAFSSQQGEYGDDAMGITMGLLDTADNGGAIRKVTEKRKMGQANTKASRKRAMQMAQHVNNKDGLASSVVFTQTTGMELVNPEANKQKVRAANEKWFKDNAGFSSALPKKGA